MNLTNIVWSVFSCYTIFQEGAGAWNSLFLLLIASGIAAGGTLSLAADKSLGRAFVLIIWLGHAPVYSWLGDWSTALAITIYCFYLTFQTGNLHKFLVGALLTQQQLLLTTKDLRNANLEAREAQAVAEEATHAKSRFLSTISHEIRTPLNGVLGTNLLLSDTELSEEQEEYTNTIKTCGEALLSLINRVLDFSKLEAGKQSQVQEDFDLHEILQQAIDIVKVSAQKKKLRTELSLDSELPRRARGNPGHLRQILLNLLGNAVKFTDAGEVSLTATLVESDEQGFRVTISVSDTGIGITKDHQEALFKPFEQVQTKFRDRGGTGLGLSISRGLAEAMRGSLTLESEKGRGSVFTLDLPFRKAQADKPSVKASQNALASARNASKKILVVEDNATNQKILQKLLTKAGYDCEVACDGLEAVTKVRAGSYDLVLMDCHMPTMDGYEATRSILENLGDDAPIIIAVTANATTQDRKRCLDCGMTEVLTKPVRLPRLQEMLNRYL